MIEDLFKQSNSLIKKGYCERYTEIVGFLQKFNGIVKNLYPNMTVMHKNSEYTITAICFNGKEGLNLCGYFGDRKHSTKILSEEILNNYVLLDAIGGILSVINKELNNFMLCNAHTAYDLQMNLVIEVTTEAVPMILTKWGYIFYEGRWIIPKEEIEKEIDREIYEWLEEVNFGYSTNVYKNN